MRGGGAIPPVGAADVAGGFDAVVSVRGAPGVRAYCRVPGVAPGRAGGAADGLTENADREEVDNMRGMVNRIR